jgi:molecular chaperone DnaK
VDTGLSGKITDIPPAPDGTPYPVEVEFSYNTNGIATVKATIPAIGKSTEITYGKSDLRMDEQDKAEATERIRDLWRNNEKAKRYEGLIERADRFMAGIPPQERSPLSRAVTELKEALTVDSKEEIDKAGDRLVDLMFDMENQG